MYIIVSHDVLVNAEGGLRINSSATLFFTHTLLQPRPVKIPPENRGLSEVAIHIAISFVPSPNLTMDPVP